MKTIKKSSKEETEKPNYNIIRAKKALALTILIFGSMGIMQIFQLGPWTLNPGLKYPYLSFIADPRYNFGISCATPKDCVLYLNYGEDKSDLNLTLKDSKATDRHFFELENLKSDTTYYWKLSCSDKNINYDFLDEVYSFHTAPEPISKKKFKFCIVGDTRPDFFGFSRFSKLMDMIIDEEPNFVVDVGDIVMGPCFSWQWDRFFYEIRKCADIGAAFMNCMGNHEWNEWTLDGFEDKGQTYKYWMNYPHEETYYAFNYSNAAFIFINDNPGDIDETQKEAVRRWLAAANRSSEIDWIIVYGHYPIYYGNGKNTRVGDAFEQMFIDYNIDMFIAGHNHHYARSEVNGIVYIISGGGGSELDLELNNPEFIDKSAITFHYCTIEINGDKLKFEAISHNGIKFDELELESERL
ncbi:MAG: metallophosphoesterase [Promethearchaeota archaeon]